MDKKKRKTVGDLLKEVHVQMVNNKGIVITQEELARYYEINYQVFNKYYNDERNPTGENLVKIGAKTPEIYDVLGLERPDQRILEIQKLYKDAPAGLKDELYEQLKRVFEELGAHPLD